MSQIAQMGRSGLLTASICDIFGFKFSLSATFL